MIKMICKLCKSYIKWMIYRNLPNEIVKLIKYEYEGMNGKNSERLMRVSWVGTCSIIKHISICIYIYN